MAGYVDKLSDKPIQNKINEGTYLIGVQKNEEGKDVTVRLAANSIEEFKNANVENAVNKAEEYAKQAAESAAKSTDGTKNALHPRTQNLEAASVDVLYTAQSDDSYAEIKTVPENVLPYAKIKAIGGGTVEKGMSMVHPNPITSIVSGDYTYAVPDDIAALPNWGHGVGKYVNYVDLEKKQYVQNCVMAELDEAFDSGNTYVHSLTFEYPEAESEKYESAIKTIICSHPEITFEFTNPVEPNEGIASGALIPMINGEMPTVEALQAFIDEQKAAGTPITVVYGWAEPTVTDISDIAEDVYIPVSAGGKVIFENYACDLLYNSIEYYVKKEIAAGGGDVDNSYLSSNFSNAIKGTLSGEAVAAKDVSPIEHDLKVKLTTKNLLRLKDDPPTTTGEGVTVIYNADGSIVLSGQFTAGENGTSGILKPWETPVLVPGKYYKFSGTATAENFNVYIYPIVNGSGWAGGKFEETDVFEGLILEYYAEAGATVVLDNLIIYPMLEESETVTSWAPYRLEGVTVSRYGKNLFDISKIKEKAGNAGTIINNGDSITITASSNSAGVNSGATLKDLAPGMIAGYEYTMSATNTGTSKYLYLSDAKLSWAFGSAKNVTNEMLDSKVLFYASGINTTATISDIQIELGEAATAYEPYIEPQSAVSDADGNVSGLVSLSPGMTLMSDTEGVTINCEYNRDAGAVVGDLMERIAALEAAAASN